jgi:hypothetical protein
VTVAYTRHNPGTCLQVLQKATSSLRQGDGLWVLSREIQHTQARSEESRPSGCEGTAVTPPHDRVVGQRELQSLRAVSVTVASLAH